MPERTELDLLDSISLKSAVGHPIKATIDLEWERLRRQLEGLNETERSLAAIQAARLWRSLATDKKAKYVRLLSGLPRTRSSSGSLRKLSQSVKFLSRLATLTDMPTLAAEAKLAEGLYFVITGRLDKAVVSLELSKAIFATSQENKYDVIRASILLGDVLSMSGDKQGAMSALMRARNLCLEIEDAPLLGSVCQALGVLHLESGDFRSAQRCFDFVVQSSMALGAPKRLIRGMLGVALCRLRTGRLAESRGTLNEAIKLAEPSSLFREICLVHEYVAEIELLEGNWTTALAGLRRAFSLSISRQLGDDIRIELHRKLVEFWVAYGRNDRAILHLERTKSPDATTPDLEDHLALSRLGILLEEGSPESAIGPLMDHADRARSLGYGYEYLLTCYDIARTCGRLNRFDMEGEWWSRVEFLAKACDAEPLLERWRRERQERLGRSRTPYEFPEIADETPVSRLARELPPVDLAAFGIITKSKRLHEQASSIAQIAPTTVPVLIQGESGTGKELFARLVHDLSPRAGGPFLAINCGAIPNEILESELFGHRRGSFTGAMTDKIGLFRAAHLGTLFLDEIGEMAPSAQIKLLRILETGELRRIGDTQIERVDVRIVAATNVDLAREVAQRKFRKDLFYRLKGLEVSLLPLRERMGDIPVLAQHFLDRSCASSGKRLNLPFPTLQWLMGLPWPGNVRELRLGVERAAAMAQDGAALQPYHFFGTEQTIRQVSLPDELEAIERERVLHALESAGWNKTNAARLLGMSRTTLAGRIKKLGIEDREK